MPDAIVVGAGPNGLAAAIELARAGWSVCVYEARETVGGGTRSAELTLPGFTHDICSAIHPLGLGSPYFLTLPLHEYGLEWIHPGAPLAHPFDDGSAAILWRSMDATANTLGHDGDAYKKLFTPLVDNWQKLSDTVLGPLHFPKHPWVAACFAMQAFRSAKGLAEATFQTPKARAFFAGLAAHSMMPIENILTSAIALVLGTL